jgi:uncharacterized protein (TIGR02391 family)
MDEDTRTQLQIIAAQAREISEALAHTKVEVLDPSDNTDFHISVLTRRVYELLDDPRIAGLLPPGPSRTRIRGAARSAVMVAAQRLAAAVETLLAGEPGRIEELEQERQALEAKLREAEAHTTAILGNLFESLNLHPRIARASQSLFASGHYAQAIFEAFKEVNNLVKAKSGLTDLDGKQLMAKAFDENRPIINVSGLTGRSSKDEREGFKFLFMGSMAGIRNPKAHELTIQTDPLRTLEYLALASLLAKRVDEGEVEALATPQEQLTNDDQRPA